MIGRRIECPFDDGGGLLKEWPQPGDYYFRHMVGWQACTPDGRLASLSAHDVTVHDDGTITVGPSILVRGGGVPGEWHGYLERGVWRSV